MGSSAPVERQVPFNRTTSTDDSPWSVNLMALPTRLTMIWRNRLASPIKLIGHFGLDLERELQTLFVGPQGQASASSKVSRRRKAWVEASLPASILEKSRMSLRTSAGSRPKI